MVLGAPARAGAVLGLCRLDRLPYLEGLRLMEALANMRREGEVPDILLHVQDAALAQHPPVYTIGKRGGEEDILVGREELERLGVEVHHIPRGGEVTFHGPGQAVLYPIADLRGLGVGARRFVEGLEDCMIETAALHGVHAQGRLKGSTGVWVGDPPTRKIGAIGVRISRGVSTHGLAMNICPDLSYYRHIVPCGAVGKDVTSLERETGGGVDLDYGLVAGQLVDKFTETFGYQEVRPVEDVVGVVLARQRAG